MRKHRFTLECVFSEPIHHRDALWGIQLLCRVNLQGQGIPDGIRLERIRVIQQSGPKPKLPKPPTQEPSS